jgi:hypothetical protein
MEAFLKLYGFCRNIAFISFESAIAFGIRAAFAAWEGPSWFVVERYLQFGFAAVLLGLALLHRYLKFHRLYSVEVLVTFANTLPKGGSRQ